MPLAAEVETGFTRRESGRSAETRAAELAGRIGDGLVSTAPDAELVEAFLGAGGKGPRYGQVTVCYAKSEKEARRTA